MKLLFNHLAKNGGDSVHHVLSDILGPMYANLNENGFGKITAETELDNLLSYTRSPSHLALGSHVMFPKAAVRQEIMEVCPGIAIVRDPADRISSLYSYAKVAEHLPYHQVAISNDLDTFFDLLKESKHVFTFPAQRSQLMYEPGVQKSGRNPEAESLEAIEKFLKQHYLLVGVTENMGLFYEMLQVLIRQLFRQHDLVVPHAHTNRKSDSEKQRLSASNLQKLKNNVHSDYAMHDWLSEQGVFFNEALLDRIASRLHQ